MKKALVVLSGGQDSTTCLYWAKNHGFKEIHTLFFDYGQKHLYEEMEAFNVVCTLAKIPDQRKHTINTDIFEQLADSALFPHAGDINSKSRRGAFPASFVPGRNLLFLVTAAAVAYKHDIHDIVTGVGMEDYSGYPDCREETINQLEIAINLGLEDRITIHTPLMHLSKKLTVMLASNLPGCMEAMKWTHTCYNGQYPPCGECPSCKLRERGFREAGIEDPIYSRS